MNQSFATRLAIPVVTAFGLLFSATVCTAQDRPIAETTSSTMGYETVAAAMADLRSKPGVVFTTENSWVIATDRPAMTIWSFAPEEYPAYPAVVMRKVVPRGQQSAMVMSVICEASKAECDDLVRTFGAMNLIPVQE